MNTLLEKLQDLFPGASNATLRKKLAHKTILVNGVIEVSSKRMIEKTDVVEARKHAATLAGDIPVLFEDKDIVVVIKPHGLLTVDTPHTRNSLHALLKKTRDVPVIYPIHRLDKDTSGVLVFAKNVDARDGLKKQLAERTVMRKYRAVVHGKMQKDAETVSLPLKEGPNYTMVVDDRGIEAISSYRVLKRMKETTAVELRLQTGRKNQIRVHMKALGHPLVGDTKYGTEDTHKRLMLHAFELAFQHPITGTSLRFTAPLPKGF